VHYHILGTFNRARCSLLHTVLTSSHFASDFYFDRRVISLDLSGENSHFNNLAGLNHQHILQRLGVRSIIPARRLGVPNGAIRNQMFRAFPKKPYRLRAKIESIFSAVKRTLSSLAPDVAWPRRSAKPCRWAWPTMFTP
jgi:hypothetical protein